MKKYISINPYLLLGIAGLHACALVVKGIDVLEISVLISIGIAVAYITYHSIFNGFLIAATEIFVGGHGHLISADLLGFLLSLRIVIFVAIMSSWALVLLQKKISLTFNIRQHFPFVILLGAIALGGIIGLLNGNPTSYIFDDANGYMALGLLLPLLSIAWDEEKKSHLIQALITSAAWISVTTIILSYCFTHFGETIMRPLYVFIRDARLAEITLQSIADSSGNITQPLAATFFGESGYWYRIFMQSQLFVCAAWLITTAYTLSTKEKNTHYTHISVLTILFSATIFLSQSRSFFVGTALAFLGVLAATAYVQRKTILIFTQRIAHLTLLGICSLILVWGTVVFPIPSQPDISRASFYSTSIDTNRDTAITSRWSLLEMMNEKIQISPVIGSGFGTTITYISDDPTVREMQSNGLLETYRFEWGYQDIWIKMGLLGLIAFGVYMVVVGKKMWDSSKNSENIWIDIGLAAFLIMIFTTHIFSPYLNHPIGSIAMLLPLPFIYTRKMDAQKIQTAHTIM